ncbi:MAG: AzlC family ABC transporter permease [Clostridia bacterium]|nr:AzlC family ABC transporter permease [Clostridia bacterium]
MKNKTAALKAAFPYTVPIMMGYLVLGTAYGIYMSSVGLPPLYTVLASTVIYAGAMQFVTTELLLGLFDPIGALLLTVMVNARHLFYGLSMLGKYKKTGRKRWYLIFGLTDETFSVNCTVEVPQGVEKGWFYFFITLLDQCYWVAGSAIGAFFGSLLKVHTEGLEFVMTALMVVLFLEQWLKEKQHLSAILGVGMGVLSLVIFGKDGFIIPAMLAILLALTLGRRLPKKEGTV